LQAVRPCKIAVSCTELFTGDCLTEQIVGCRSCRAWIGMAGQGGGDESKEDD
jgi:hypothetical protein